MDEIIYNIVRTNEKEKDYDELIDKCGKYLIDNFDIKENELNWQEIEERIYFIKCNLTHFFSSSKLLKILQNIKWKGKFVENDNLEINSSELNIDAVYKICYEDFIDTCKSIGENAIIEDFTEKTTS